jgi:hypothetical protein
MRASEISIEIEELSSISRNDDAFLSCDHRTLSKNVNFNKNNKSQNLNLKLDIDRTDMKA